MPKGIYEHKRGQGGRKGRSGVYKHNKNQGFRGGNNCGFQKGNDCGQRFVVGHVRSEESIKKQSETIKRKIREGEIDASIKIKQMNTPAANAKKGWHGTKRCDHCKKEYVAHQRQQKWCEACVPDKHARRIMQKYKLSVSEYLGMIKEISGICPICKKHNATVVDHCHKTGKVRGIICNHCNVALPIVEDSEILARAIKYLNI